MTTHRTQSLTPSPSEFVALILDTDPVSCLSARALLESEGGRVIEIENGTDILAAFHKHQPDIILLGAQMPEINSFDLCIQIQALPNGSNTPILILAALDDEASVNLALAVGAADYVTKPIHPVILRQRVRRLLQVHRVDEAVVRAKKEWEAACDAVSDIIILTDLNGKIIRCNFATTQRLQMTYLQLIGCDLRAVLLKDTSQKLSLPFGQPLEIQFPSLPGWFEVRTFPGQLEGRPHAIVYILKDITERKQLEENVRQSEQRFQALVENISEGVELFDLEGRVRYASPMVAHILGFPDNTDFVGINPMNNLHPDDQERNLALFTQLLQHPGGSFTTELRVRHQDGSWIWVESTARNMLDEPGINAILVNFKDISKRKRAEESLRASEARYRTLFEDSPVALWEEDFSEVNTFFDYLRTEKSVTDFRAYFEAHPEAVTEAAARVIVKDVNKAAMKMLGAQRKEELIEGMNLVLSPETNTAFREELISIANGSTYFTAEIPNHTLNGDTRYTSVIWSVWRGYEDTLSKVTVSLVDLTERRHAEKMLKQTEERLRLIVETVPIPILINSSADGTILFANTALGKLIGLPVDELLGRQMPDFYIYSLQRQSLLDILKRDGRVRNHELPIKKANQAPLWVLASIQPLTFANQPASLSVLYDITERKQMEEALRLSEERFQLVTYATNDAVWDVNLQTGQQWWNRGVQLLFGYAPGQVGTNQAWWESRIHPNDRDKVLDSFQAALDGDDRFWSKEYRFRRANGTYAHVFDRGYIILDEQGHPWRAIGAIMDLTDRKQSEEALRRREQQLEDAQQIAHLGNWEWDAKTDAVTWSNELYRLYGYEPQAIALSTNLFLQTMNPEDRERVWQIIQHGLQTCEPFYYDYRITVDSEVRWLHVRAEVVLGEDNQPLRLYGTTQDITERKRMEEALIKSEELFSKAFHASPAPMAITRIDNGILIDVNQSWEHLLGYSRRAAIGRPILDLNVYINPQDRARITDLIREQGKLEDFEIKIRTESKEEREVLISAQGVEIQDQACLLSTLYDITELHRMHEAMLASQKLADLGTLAAGVAHEMNSPLQVITGVSESLLKKTRNGSVDVEQLSRNLDVIHRNGWRCAEIVRSLHTYARNSGGPMQLANLNELVSDGLLLIEHQLKSWANISVRTELASDLPSITCDHNQITQVLINLLTNARDAMPEGGEITIATGYDPKTDQLILAISDTGMGIPDSIRGKIFDPFFTTKSLGKGTGLGLSIVAGIVRAHGGAIDVESAPRQGTTFTARFPTNPPKLPASDTGDTYGRFDNTICACSLISEHPSFEKEFSHDQDTSS